ncbi:MAG TPA: cupredoxin domain-containing protein [Nitrospirota bacterium]|nr:cupredoxin domain-containing protein [Nitrospirota bacterium]
MTNSKRFVVPIVLSMVLVLAGLAAAADQSGTPQVIKITAKRFEYNPNVIKIKTGVPVIFEFTSLDRVHGFTVPDLGGIRQTIEPGKVNRITILAPKAGTYEFRCDLFCGEGHEGMTGKIIVED